MKLPPLPPGRFKPGETLLNRLRLSASSPREEQSGALGLTSETPALKIEKPAGSAGLLFAALPPRSMVGQLPLEQHIGVRIPGGQPIVHFLEPSRTFSFPDMHK
jgi:hypothetical protein